MYAFFFPLCFKSSLCDFCSSFVFIFVVGSKLVEWLVKWRILMSYSWAKQDSPFHWFFWQIVIIIGCMLWILRDFFWVKFYLDTFTSGCLICQKKISRNSSGIWSWQNIEKCLKSFCECERKDILLNSNTLPLLGRSIVLIKTNDSLNNSIYPFFSLSSFYLCHCSFFMIGSSTILRDSFTQTILMMNPLQTPSEFGRKNQKNEVSDLIDNFQVWYDCLFHFECSFLLIISSPIHISLTHRIHLYVFFEKMEERFLTVFQRTSKNQRERALEMMWGVWRQ